MTRFLRSRKYVPYVGTTFRFQFLLFKRYNFFVGGANVGLGKTGRIDANASVCASRPSTHGRDDTWVYDGNIYIFQAPMSLPHPTTLTSIHASLPHFLPSPALASPVGSPSSQPNIAVSNAQCSTLFVANLGQYVSEHELKDIFSRSDIFPCSIRLHFLSLIRERIERSLISCARLSIYYIYIFHIPTHMCD